MKVWITKYALTQGVYEVEGEASFRDGMFCVPRSEKSFAAYYHKPDWHETKEEAIAQAEKMREAKVKSLERQLAKIQAMQFV